MEIKENVCSSNLQFKRLEVNVDTVFVRYNEKKWIEDNVHVGWIYDEIWYNKDKYIEKVSTENEVLSQALVESMLVSEQTKVELEMAMVEIVNIIGGM